MRPTRRSLLQALSSLAIEPSIGATAALTEAETINAPQDRIPIYDGNEFIYYVDDGDSFEFGFGTYDPETQTLNRLT